MSIRKNRGSDVITLAETFTRIIDELVLTFNLLIVDVG
jgi:hypothetical protein